MLTVETIIRVYAMLSFLNQDNPNYKLYIDIYKGDIISIVKLLQNPGIPYWALEDCSSSSEEKRHLSSDIYDDETGMRYPFRKLIRRLLFLMKVMGRAKHIAGT